MQHSAQFRLGPPIFDQVENWQRAQSKIPTRSDAIRKLLERGLEAERRDAALCDCPPHNAKKPRYRRGIVALRVRSIGKGARLVISSHGSGFRHAGAVRTASLMRSRPDFGPMKGKRP